jgi:dihydrodipicolinate synthase/N-acetylneuraminate lyase
MFREEWFGVFPAITTPFAGDLSVDGGELRAQVTSLLDAGCRGIVALGSLGEAATLDAGEKLAVLKACREATAGRVPLVAGIAGLSTAECVRLAREAEAAGCDGLMVLPPYVYRGDWRETSAHFRAVIEATPLACMLYNNPVAYGTDVLPGQIAELVEHENLHAVKESSGDARRVAAIREALGERLAIFVGVDDVIVESLAVGAVGWIAGLVNALPAESVRLFELARAGKTKEALELYEWFLPLLRLDTVPKFVQLIKLVQAEAGRGSARVRPPRLELAGEELAAAVTLIREKLARRPL